MTKVCRKCGAEKALSEFVKRKSSPDGRRTFCKACLNMERRQKRAELLALIQKGRTFPPFKGYGLPECRGW